ncbi:MAG: hypothetical protein HZC49_07505 [Nitrospirae bacterium]|nr:hypothetical protein [Nitrospirota bacterium]
MKGKNYAGIIGTVAPKYVHRGETFYKEVIKKLDAKTILWSALHIGGFMFVASILFLLVMLIATS